MTSIIVTLKPANSSPFFPPTGVFCAGLSSRRTRLVKKGLFHHGWLGDVDNGDILHPEQPLQPVVRPDFTKTRTPSRSRTCDLLSMIGGKRSNPRTVRPSSPGCPSHKPWPHWGLWNGSGGTVCSGLPHRLTSPVSRCQGSLTERRGEKKPDGLPNRGRYFDGF